MDKRHTIKFNQLLERVFEQTRLQKPLVVGDSPTAAVEEWARCWLEHNQPKKESHNKDAVLCYVSLPWAYFTTKELADQWGDDWNDAPYEHNAGTPYEPCWHRKNGGECACDICYRDWNEDGTPCWKVFRVAVATGMIEPCDGLLNSPYSVQDINSGEVPWLETDQRWNEKRDSIAIYAGTTFEEFVTLVKQAGGSVYQEV